MQGVTFRETLRRSVRGMLFWGAGIGLIGFMSVIVIPDADALDQMADLLETFPPEFLAIFSGGSGVDMAFMSTPEGYLTINYFSLLGVMFAAYGLTLGMSITANDEERGVLDTILSLPIPRRQLVVEKALAAVLLLIGANLIAFALLWLGVVLTPAIEVNFAAMLRGSIYAVPAALATFGVTLLLTTVLRRRGLALGMAVAFVVASYFLDALGAAVSGSFINELTPLSIFSYYKPSDVIQEGLVWGHVLLLVAVALVGSAAATVAFQRRDVGV